jgi:hypothetical protein
VVDARREAGGLIAQPLSISVIISPTGMVTGRSWRDDTQQSGTKAIGLSGLDGRLLRRLETWLMDHERAWDVEDIRVFGGLLHRLLFPENEVWSWIQKKIDDRGPDLVRLQLAFHADANSSRLARLPWEFLCTPDRPGNDGRFLVLTPGVLLARSVPPGTPDRAPVVLDDGVRILPVVGDAENAWLGPVDYEPALDAIAAAGARHDFTVVDAVEQVDLDTLVATVAEERPHVVHYIGHGRFTEDTGRGSIALRATDGQTQWVDENDLADGLCTDEWAPTVVVLHACEGGRTDYEYRHAGLAPALVRRGVQCVVAMQYPVTNEQAIAFSSSLYDALAKGQYLDEAVQTARDQLWKTFKDPRLLGVPMVYQRNAAPLLGAPTGVTGA